MLNPPWWLGVLMFALIPAAFAADYIASQRRARSRPANPPTGRVAVAAHPPPPGVAVTALELAAAGVLTPPPGVQVPHRHGPELSPARSAGGVRAAGRAAALAQTSSTAQAPPRVCVDQPGRGDVDRHPEGRADEVGPGLDSGERVPAPTAALAAALRIRGAGGAVPGAASPGTATASTPDSPAPRPREAA